MPAIGLYRNKMKDILKKKTNSSSLKFSEESSSLIHSNSLGDESHWFPECSVCDEKLPAPEMVSINGDLMSSKSKAQPLQSGVQCCKINGTEADCRNCSLTTIPSTLSPNITVLLLGHNLLTDASISGGAFKRYPRLTLLSLSSNLITSLADDAFEGLPLLRCLCLQYNNIKMDEGLNSSLTFQPLAQSLVYLRLNGINKNTTHVNLMYPSYAIGFLSNLKYLYMDGIPLVRFENPQKKLPKLTHLGLAGFWYGNCNLTGLQSRAFEFNTLTHLDISDCNLKGSFVNRSALENLQSLQNLTISNNYALGIQNVGHLMYSQRNNKNLKVLTMQRINPRFSPCIVIYKSTLENFKNTGLEEIYAMDNKIETIERGALKLLPKTLKLLNLTNNKIIFGDYFKDLGKMKGLTSLILDGSYKSYGFPYKYPTNVLNNCAGHSSSVRETVAPEGDEDSYIKSIPVPPNLMELSMYGNEMMYSLNNMTFSKNNNLKTANLRLNVFQYLDGPIKGLEKLEILKMDLCLIKKISCEFFEYFLSLKFLSLNQNQLSETLDADENGCIFQNLTQLIYMDLSLNDLYHLHPLSFKNLVNLKYLNVSQNRIQRVNFSLTHMMNLEILDLQKNQIQSLSPETRFEIDKIREGGAPLLVNLSYNPISCNCDNLSFLEWLSETALADFDFNGAHYYCSMEKQPEGYRETIGQLRRQCIKQEALFGVVISATMIAVLAIVAVLAYRFRWTLRYWYHAARLKFQPVISPEQFEFDVFVSYSDKDDFVEEELIPRLQDEFNFRVMMHGLCFPAGGHITDSIHTAVTTSRKTLVVITKNMLRSHWCNYELMV
ncbi:hypothetical protein EGW08_017977 [Elysia chlorotica]|uniref:TIR domain-containing protein n=1 Tax=Elysia chlorotica TaxID=188477 RepID=A0A3S1B258_ELYCH|nr:hypothetical protein EGW08_017977 [Elysia chlorotica]